MKLHEIVDRLKSTGVKPIKEFVASGGKNYGYICVFKINKKYIIQCSDGISTLYEITDDYIESLDDWSDLLSNDRDFLYRLEVKDINSIDSMEPFDDVFFNILKVKYWNDGSKTIDLVRDEDGAPLNFISYSDSKEWIEDKNDQIYHSYKIIQLPFM